MTWFRFGGYVQYTATFVFESLSFCWVLLYRVDLETAPRVAARVLLGFDFLMASVGSDIINIILLLLLCIVKYQFEHAVTEI